MDSALDDASERGGAMYGAAQDAAYSIEESLEDVIAQRPLATSGHRARPRLRHRRDLAPVTC